MRLAIIRLAPVAALGLMLITARPAAAQCDPSVCAGVDVLQPWNGALEIPRFDNLKAAKAQCKSDPVVWVTGKMKGYYTARSSRFGKGKPGVYVCRADMRKMGVKAGR